MASFLGVKKCVEGMVDTMKADALPLNPNFTDAIAKSKQKNINELEQ
jgi:hypothetical protein